jgi:toxin CptA
LLCAALAGLGVLAAIALGVSALPLPAKPPLCALALGYGAWLARREWRRPACTVEFAADGSAVMRAGASCRPMRAPRLALRGALACLAWRDEDGRGHSHTWCADTLPPPARRLLRLRFGAPATEAGT